MHHSRKNCTCLVQTLQKSFISSDHFLEKMMPSMFIQLMMLSALAHRATSDVNCEEFFRLYDEIKELRQEVKNLTTERKEVKDKLDSLTANKSSVAFTARFSADIEAGIVIGLNQILQFDDVVTNVGNGYDPYTGIFTAPVPGTYAIFLTIMGTGARDGTLKIEKGGAPLNYVHTMPSLNQGSTMMTSHFRAGEKVFIRQNSQVAIRGSWYTVFSGFLIHAD